MKGLKRGLSMRTTSALAGRQGRQEASCKQGISPFDAMAGVTAWQTSNVSRVVFPRDTAR